MKSAVGWRISGVAVLITAVMATVAQAQQPTVVFSIRGIEPLLSDAEFVGGEVGQDEIRSTAEQFVGAFTGGKGLAGIDKTKPLGLYWNSTAGGPPEMPIVFVPVSDADELKELLGELTADFKDSKGQWSMTVNGQKLFAKISGGYCFISNTPTALTKLSDPAKFANTKYDVALDINIASIPAELKSAALAQIEANGRQALEASPEPESEAEKAGRDLGFNGTLHVMKALINDGDKLTWGVDLDQKTRLAAMDLSITGKPNTGLAKTLTAYGKTIPTFAAIGSNTAPFRMVVSFPTTGLSEEFDTFFNLARESADKHIDEDPKIGDSDREAAKSIASRLFDIAQATAKSGSMHSGIVLEAGGTDKIRMIGGTKLAQGDDASKLLDDAIELSKEKPEAGKFKLDAAKHAGARIHSVVPEQTEENENLFGSEPAHLAIRADSLWMSLGGDNLAALKKALDVKPAVRATSSPISIQIKPAALVVLMEKKNEDLVERAKEVAGKPGDKLNIDVAPITNGAKLRVEVGVELLQLADQEDE